MFSALDLDWGKYVVIDSSLLRPSDIRYGKGDLESEFRVEL